MEMFLLDILMLLGFMIFFGFVVAVQNQKNEEKSKEMKEIMKIEELRFNVRNIDKMVPAMQERIIKQAIKTNTTLKARKIGLRWSLPNALDGVALIELPTYSQNDGRNEWENKNSEKEAFIRGLSKQAEDTRNNSQSLLGGLFTGGLLGPNRR